jgi:hypothetical protein
VKGDTLVAREADLREALEGTLPGALPVSGSIVGLVRRPMPYRSSFALEDLEVTFEDGTIIQAVFKDLSPGGLLPDGRRAMPDFLYDPFREIETYRTILPEIIGPPAYFGALADGRSSRWWLFLERVQGVPLTEVGDIASWGEAARWLARMHRRFAGLGDPMLRATPLIRHDAAYYRRWLGRSREVLGRARPDVSAQTRARFDRLAAGYEELVLRLTDLPTTFLHGEFFPSNVLIEGTGPATRIRPVDWEMASIGPGAIDLAALVGGGWSEAERASVSLAYREEMAGPGPPLDEEAFLRSLDMCRLHLAIQRLGWSLDWSPPPEHAHDWLGEALSLSERLGL